jgi:DNA-binding beta-propeller fold protein YncE
MKICLISLICLAGALCNAATPLGSYNRSLQAPARVAADAAGNIYVTDPQAGQVVVFDPFGRQLNAHDGFAGPLGIAVDTAGQIYLAESKAGSVSVFDAQWNLLYRLGAGANEFQMPNYIAIDAASNAVYVSDSKANLIKVYAGATLVKQFGGAGTGNGQFSFPAGVCVSTNGEVFVVDQYNDRIQVFDRAGNYLRKFKFGGTMGPSGRKQGVLVDNSGRLYVADTYQGLIRVYNSTSGSLLATLGGFGPGNGQLSAPSGLALDPYGLLYVASVNNGRVELFGLDTFVHLTTSLGGDVVAVGTNVVFSAVTGGAAGFTFQWLKNGVAIDGATGATLSVNNANEADSGGYSVVVNGVTSSVASVSVLVPPSIASDPQGGTVLRGSNVRFAVSATGSALRYQWQFNGQSIPGATNNVLALDNAQATDSGSYCLSVQNALGSLVSPIASLRVIRLEVQSTTMDESQQLHLTVNADVGLTYALDASADLVQWEELTNFVNDAELSELIDADSANYSQRYYRLRFKE